MQVRFRRTGARRYAVVVNVEGESPRAMDPAPAYDDDIPHDLVHYVVEAELGLANGVYGRAARGAGAFVSTAERDVAPRERARKQRKQRRRERAVGAQDERHAADMARSERLAALCDVAWRRKHGQHADPLRSAPVARAEDAADVGRVVSRLDVIAPLWRALPVGQELVFEWPTAAPVARPPAAAERPRFDHDFWEQLWSKTLREHADKVARRPPNAHLVAQAADLAPGRALDAGCGHGADALWLAARGWQVTAVDFSAAALAQGRSMAEAAGADVADRIEWIESDLATWTVQPGRYQLVVCLYVHVAGSVAEVVGRMASGVAPGGTLLLVGHRPIDPATGAATAAANQVQVSVEGAIAALEPNAWELVVAEERPRAVAGTGVDAVICARRRT